MLRVWVPRIIIDANNERGGNIKMKKNYIKPTATKVAFVYREQVVATSGPDYGPQIIGTGGLCIHLHSGAGIPGFNVCYQ